MEFWPADLRTQNFDISRRGKSKAKEKAWGYPVLDHGALAAATLVKNDGSLKWTCIDSHDAGRRLVDCGKSTKIFPATRRADKADINHTRKQRAEQGTRFLRTYYPDVDIPYELLLDEISRNDEIVSTQASFDPYFGNTVESLCCPDGPRKRSTMLAFPTGAVGQNLNVSPFLITKHDMRFEPTALPVWSFGTPIRQIVSSSPALNPQRNNDHVLAVRTFGQVTLFDVRNNTQNITRQSKAAVHLSNIFCVDTSQLDNHAAMDMTFCQSSTSKHPELWLVNSKGAVFQYNTGYSCNTIAQLQGAPSEYSENGRWMIAAGHKEHCGIVASEKTVKVFDTRASSSDIGVFTMADSRSAVTSIEAPKLEHLMCISTTNELVWLDIRSPKRPLLGWRHHRAFDRTLQVRTIDMGELPITFLTSRKTGLVTAYAIKKILNGPFQASLGPCALPHMVPNSTIHGSAFIRQSETSTSLGFIVASDKGSLHSLDLEYIRDAAAAQEKEWGTSQCITYKWPADVEELDVKSRILQAEDGRWSRREFKEADLSGLYGRLFKETSGYGDATVESVYDILEKMPSFTQRSDVDVEHLWTTFDIAFCSGDDPIQLTKADFLTGTALNSVPGYRALKQGRVPFDELAKKAAWHLHLMPILHSISSDIPLDLPAPSSLEMLLPYVLDPGDSERPAPVIQRESEARDQLALDLALSADVYSTTPFINMKPEPSDLSREKGEAFETSAMLCHATQALSLKASEPPSLNFGHFRPVHQDGMEHYDSENTRGTMQDADEEQMLDNEKEEKLVFPIGVRLLVAEWSIGSNPEEYSYDDPYNVDARRPGTTQARLPDRIAPRTDTQPTQPTHIHRPPLVVPAASLDPNPNHPSSWTNRALVPTQSMHNIAPALPQKRHQLLGGSQGPASQHALDHGSSQEFMTNTQVLPGPFGGRQAAGKKVAKKRIGGF